MIYFKMLKMLRLSIILIVLSIAVAGFLAEDAAGFKSRLGPDGDCAKCHTLDIKEAASIIKAMNPAIEVLGVGMGPVEGLWEVIIRARGKKGIAYVDFSKKHIITGSILKVTTRENLTSLRLYDISKVDLSVVPLDEALVLGKRDAKYKVVVFDDPD
jgi:thiol:disulfide interchange protein DsbC